MLCFHLLISLSEFKQPTEENALALLKGGKSPSYVSMVNHLKKQFHDPSLHENYFYTAFTTFEDKSDLNFIANSMSLWLKNIQDWQNTLFPRSVIPPPWWTVSLILFWKLSFNSVMIRHAIIMNDQFLPNVLQTLLLLCEKFKASPENQNILYLLPFTLMTFSMS